MSILSPTVSPSVTGERQSPIDIQTNEVVNERSKRAIDPEVSPLHVDYSQLKGVRMVIENTGHGWQLNVPDEHARKCPITGGTLGRDKYRLLQIHAHWGKNSRMGSEHRINGQTYPAEIHLVHWNTKYSNPTEAQNHTKDGIAVIGVFVQIAQTAHPVLSIIAGQLPSIPFKGDKKTFNNNHLDLNQLIPERNSPNYWFYLGSLTTPPYSESVLWLVMKTPIFGTENQISAFRELYEKERSNSTNHRVEENFRNTQRRNNRPVLNVESN